MEEGTVLESEVVDPVLVFGITEPGPTLFFAVTGPLEVGGMVFTVAPPSEVGTVKKFFKANRRLVKEKDRLADWLC